jgi:hypothetical protein
VVDPTANVLQLVDAESLRQDGLRVAEGALRAEEARGLRRELELDRRHAAEIRDLETKRLDAIRLVDVNAVQRAAEVQQAAALTLQGQVAGTAEAMRTQIAALTQSLTEAIANTVKPLADALAVVQQQQNLQAGQRIQVAESREVKTSSGQYLGIAMGALSLIAVILIALFK